VTPDVYCREIEGYLTRKNDGHLVRIVGPSFERVRAWAEQGVPLKVAFAGIDRHFERYYARGPRRRPVRIDHCEADVLDVFDEWRRALGITAGLQVDPEVAPGAARRPRESLASTLERAVARLTLLQTREPSPMPADLLRGTIAELDRLIPLARNARGQLRESLLSSLHDLDRRLLDAAAAFLRDDQRQRFTKQAEEDLRPFSDRMPAGAWQRAVSAGVDRAVREHAGLPDLTTV
jgi:hypothetical protein